jgi:hypothetical protein
MGQSAESCRILKCYCDEWDRNDGCAEGFDADSVCGVADDGNDCGRFMSVFTNLDFMFYHPARVESARQLCEASATHNTSAHILLVVQELLGNLAKICEGKATSDLKKKSGDVNLQPFRTYLLDNKSVCEELRMKTCSPLNPSEVRVHGLGFIYILRSQSYGNLWLVQDWCLETSSRASSTSASWLSETARSVRSFANDTLCHSD